MYNRKLTEEQSLAIMHSKEKGSFLAHKYGISESMVSKIRRKKARAGDLDGRPLTAMAGSESGSLLGFSDRRDRDYFRRSGLCALYLERRVDGSLRMGVTEAAWMAVRAAEARGSQVFGVFWTSDKMLALRLRKEIKPALEYSEPNDIAKLLADLSRRLSIFVEDHEAMIHRIGYMRRNETERNVKKFSS